ncbi:hypothetical protein [Streptomyces candidus]|uniref:Integral membrane protein n=1 Tax=Streptomyces candidus TaxID=67283 RepID=A0A7X0HCD3_9ACTN|nr:hypothetical protein [Streptomyces candidus]MBB6435009.1 hypothetical protein [Streptomyces candidus]GHH41035.1 hypothetical protein GCM10018773_23600 [Streptomyces candidus]
MTDRRRRTAALRHPFAPLPVQPPLTAVPTSPGSPVPPADGRLLREGPSSSSSPSSETEEPGASAREDNPFAPPPEGRPDQPWRPRKQDEGDTPDNDSSSRSPWAGQWSNRQPGRGNGGFGGNGGTGRGQGGPDGTGNGPGAGLRWDPTDPTQRRARYALLAGMWAFFFAVFTQREIALLLGSLALYWGISALRDKPAASTAAAATSPPATAAAPPVSTRQQTTAAVSGLVTAGLALAIVAATFTVQMVYRDYYTCVADSLTKSAQLSCNEELPKSLIPVFGVKE